MLQLAQKQLIFIYKKRLNELEQNLQNNLTINNKTIKKMMMENERKFPLTICKYNQTDIPLNDYSVLINSFLDLFDWIWETWDFQLLLQTIKEFKLRNAI